MYDLDGSHYTNCLKKALTIRYKELNSTKTTLSQQTFRFMKGSNIYYMDSPQFKDEIPILRADLS